MGHFAQLSYIQKQAQTEETAINAYASFVKYMNELKVRIRKSNRRGWTNDRHVYQDGLNALPLFHKALQDRFGFETMAQAINEHALN